MVPNVFDDDAIRRDVILEGVSNDGASDGTAVEWAPGHDHRRAAVGIVRANSVFMADDREVVQSARQAPSSRRAHFPGQRSAGLLSKFDGASDARTGAHLSPQATAGTLMTKPDDEADQRSPSAAASAPIRRGERRKGRGDNQKPGASRNQELLDDLDSKLHRRDSDIGDKNRGTATTKRKVNLQMFHFLSWTTS